MKLLLLSPTNNPLNGYGNITHELCTSLSRVADSTLLLPRDAPKRSEINYKVEYVLPSYTSSLKSPKVVDFFRFKYQSEANVVHSLFEFPYDFIAGLIAKQNHQPLIVGAQGTFGVTPSLRWPEKYLVRWVYGQAKTIVVPSRFTKESVFAVTKTKTPITVIHNGVNFDRFQKKVPRLAAYRRKLVFLTVGGLKQRKGQDLVIRALGMVKHLIPPFDYLLVGRGKWEEELSNLAKEMKIGNRVHFLGEKTGDELVSVFKSANIYVHTPKIVDWNFEGFGIAYLEASACRLPIIATDSGGVRDAVLAGRTGLIVPENDVGGLSEAIIKLSRDKKLQGKLGENGWEYARDHDWAVIGDKFLALYRSVA